MAEVIGSGNTISFTKVERTWRITLDLPRGTGDTDVSLYNVPVHREIFKDFNDGSSIRTDSYDFKLDLNELFSDTTKVKDTLELGRDLEWRDLATAISKYCDIKAKEYKENNNITF